MFCNFVQKVLAKNTSQDRRADLVIHENIGEVMAEVMKQMTDETTK